MSWRDELISMDTNICRKCKEHYISVGDCEKEYIMCKLDCEYAENLLMYKDGCEWFEEIN